MKNPKCIRIGGAYVKQLLVILFIAAFYSLITSSIALGQVSNTELPKGKQTTLGLYVSAKEAYAKWMASPDKVMILDVRTPEEFLFVGHAPMVWTIPAFIQVYEWDPEKQRFPMMPNPDFISRAKAMFTPDDTLLVMCRSGGRSAMTVNRLAEAGFNYVYNIIDGFEGDMVKDPKSVFQGQRLKNGWKNSGLPLTYHIDPERIPCYKSP